MAYIELGTLTGESGRMRARIDAAAGRSRASTAAERRDRASRTGLLQLFVRTQLRAGAATPLIAMLFSLAVVTARWVEPLPSLLWLLAILAVSVGQLAQSRYLLRRPAALHRRMAPDTLAGRLALSGAHVMVLIEALHAVLWSLPMFLFWQPENALQHLFIIAVLMVVAVMRIFVSFSYTPVLLTGSGIITLAIVVRCILAGEMPYIVLAAIAITTNVFLLQLAYRLQQSAADMLALKAQREDLIRNLEEARDRAERARRKAEAANRAKSMFLANMSHELRTPLNAIMGFSEIISRELFGPVPIRQYREYAEDIHRSGHYLLSLINDILDLSRIEAGRHELHEEPVDIAAQGEEALKLIAFRATEKGLRINTRFAPDVPPVMADARAVRQIWLNLLSNAVKFTPGDGEITLSVKRTKTGGVALEVADTGPGMPAQEVKSVMEAFTRGRSALEGAVEGAGLGLAIVKGLASLHDAQVHFHSVEGAGTCVRVEFPPARVERASGLLHDESFLKEAANRRLVALLDA